MVKIQGPSSEYEKLDQLVREACSRHGFRLEVSGWTRKTYDVFNTAPRIKEVEHLARVESFATTNGEIRVFADEALPLAEELGKALEETFDLTEAVIFRIPAPE